VKPQAYRTHHPTPADILLIIEFANSSLIKDREEKRLLYAAAEIEDYWLVNLRDRKLIIDRHPTDGDYLSPQKLTSGTIASLSFPDVAIAVHPLIS